MLKIDAFDDYLKKIEQWLDKLKNYYFELGVVENKTNRKETYKVGITNAELMFIHENGSPVRNIPSRPVLDMTLKYAKDNILPHYLDVIYDAAVKEKCSDGLIQSELKKCAIDIQSYAQQLIYDNDGRLAPNAPSTAKAKWKKSKHSKDEQWQYPDGNHPLFDTGQLARSITCQLNMFE